MNWCEVVCIGAHPDDVELAMGGTVAKYVSMGKSVGIIDVTDGEPTPCGSPELRRAESIASGESLGICERILMQGSNRHVMDSPELRWELADVLRSLRPRILFAPIAGDAHPDHRAVHELCVAARFYMKLSKTHLKSEPAPLPALYFYESIHRNHSEEPDFFVDIADTVETKLRALACYDSQFGTHTANRSMIERIRNRNAHYGTLIGSGGAEPFWSFEALSCTPGFGECR